MTGLLLNNVIRIMLLCYILASLECSRINILVSRLLCEGIMCKYYTKKGYLTDYGLSCGYNERTSDGKMTITLYKEFNCYHVKKDDEDGGMVWQSFDKLSDARQAYKILGGVL